MWYCISVQHQHVGAGGGICPPTWSTKVPCKIIHGLKMIKTADLDTAFTSNLLFAHIMYIHVCGSYSGGGGGGGGGGPPPPPQWNLDMTLSTDTYMYMYIQCRCGCTVSLSRDIRVNHGWSCFQMSHSQMTHLKIKSKVRISFTEGLWICTCSY